MKQVNSIMIFYEIQKMYLMFLIMGSWCMCDIFKLKSPKYDGIFCDPHISQILSNFDQDFSTYTRVCTVNVSDVIYERSLNVGQC